MRVLVVGSGAREHCILWKLSQSPLFDRLFCAPGNGGTASIAENIPIAATDCDALVEWASSNLIDFVVVGPEDPLAVGLVDRFDEIGLPAFGPSGNAAAIEASKSWAKQLMVRHGIPTAAGAAFTSPNEAKQYLKRQEAPIVVKADGLAAGKGVIVATSRDEAIDAVTSLMEKGSVASAGSRVVIEEYLEGPEVSVLAFADGKTVVPMVPACDYKRVFDGDQGPNTGGMGCYSPPGFVSRATLDQTVATILEPTIQAMAQEGRPYRGVLYAGLIITRDGPKVLEFNCRFGDPETQAILPRLGSDLMEIVTATVRGDLANINVEWSREVSCGVVLASGGYPGDFSKGHAISGLDDVGPDALVFHAGTRRQNGSLVTSGGRVLTVVALGQTMAEARNRAYASAAKISFSGCHYRHDIAAREV
ncbi:MAG: phosphoribosylamine--glycine ligase [Chloroflexi bacterium]|nr:phosphoribosylamine--glycine ligase [Chloroflexota bacterium]